MELEGYDEGEGDTVNGRGQEDVKGCGEGSHIGDGGGGRGTGSGGRGGEVGGGEVKEDGGREREVKSK